MAKKKSDRPKHFSIYYDQLIYDLDFMTDENAGKILKLMVWYASNTDDSQKRITEMLEHIRSLPEAKWMEAVYRRICSAIDEDFKTYAEVCERRKQAIQKRWDDNKRIQENTNEFKSIQKNSYTVTDTVTDTDTDTDTDTVTNLSKDNLVCVSKDRADAPHTHTDSSLDENRKKNYDTKISQIKSAYPQVGKLIMPSINQLTDILKGINGDWLMFWDICRQMENNPKLLERNRYFVMAFDTFLRNNKK